MAVQMVGEPILTTGKGIIAQLACSTVSELPAVNGITGFTLLDTSICLIRQTGEFYILDGGNWYNADGSGQPTDDTETSALPDTREIPAQDIFRNVQPIDEIIEQTDDTEEPVQGGDER